MPTPTRNPSTAAASTTRDSLAAHPLYRAVSSLPRLRTFTEHHVACVWDFMSLLKSLQRDLAGTGVPWCPPADPEAARMINEIVLDEESDRLSYRDGHASHFTWYVEAMAELGADTGPIGRFVASVGAGAPPLAAMAQAGLPAAAVEFTTTTLAFLAEPLPIRAAVFLHGRENLIPKMFMPLLDSLQQQGLPCERFRGYLARHIEVDGGAHGEFAGALLARLCERQPGLHAACDAA
ncbi:MAG: DUF3050 domain-containing protein, partial [Planctomycetes bacterium]|nr:DUF3050 domain-containing protein [Planctomycetota bacterium]